MYKNTDTFEDDEICFKTHITINEQRKQIKEKTKILT